MKGNPSAPRCGFSQQTVNILKEEGVEYTSFDILQDEAVRQSAFLFSLRFPE
jgi:glutaredoxin-related protein